MSFLNRRRELKVLEQALPASGARMFVLYGRRRVGKTELLRHYFSGRPHAFFTGDLASSNLHVRGLAQRLGLLWEDSFLRSGSLSGWSELLEYLAERPRPLDLVLDEFPYLCEAEPALASLLQRHWDEHWSRGEVRLVLCGSSISFMEREVLAYPSPLFGRRTGQFRLRPLSLWEAREFLPQYTAIDRFTAYSCVGGIPAYLSRFDPSLSVQQNLLDQVLHPGAYLYEEPRLLLHQELREPRLYFAVMRALAAGRTRLNEIAQECRLPNNHASRYLETLIRLEIVERCVPVTEHPERSRKGLYRLRDPFFRFWFRFVHPNLSELERSGSGGVMEREILPGLAHFLAPAFEELCADWVGRNPARLPFRPDRIGRWWDRHQEIDLVACNDQDVLFGECKWNDNPVGEGVLEKLISRSEELVAFTNHRKHYALFSKVGFRQPLEAVMQVDLSQLSTDF